jgi:hypothetical protein
VFDAYEFVATVVCAEVSPAAMKTESGNVTALLLELLNAM